MAKPERTLWATDTNYAAGADPWSGQPNKVAPNSSRIATGYIPKNRPPAPEFNWWRNRCAEWFAFVSKMQMRTWTPMDFSRVNLSEWSPGATLPNGHLVFDPSNDIWVGVSDQGEGINAQRDGFEWDDEVGLANKLLSKHSIVGASQVRLCAGGNGKTYAAFLDSSANDLVFLRTGAYGAASWAQISPGSSKNISAIAHDQGASDGTLVVVASDGYAYYSTNAGTGWTATSPTQLGGGSGTYSSLIHTLDAGNSRFFCMTDDLSPTNNMHTSTDGINWSSSLASITGMTNKRALAYDAESGRLGVIGSSVDFWYSDDNGLTWAQVSGVFPWSTNTPMSLTCDGRGGWIANKQFSGGAPMGTFISMDNGLTWEQINQPDVIGATCGIAYGDGYFMALGTAEAHRSLLG